MEEVWNNQDSSLSWLPGQTEQFGEKGLGKRANGLWETFKRTTITATLHWSVLHGRMAWRKPLLSERHMKACMAFAKKHLKDSDCEKQDSMKPWWNQDEKVLASILSVISGGNQAPLITCPKSFQWSSMVVAASCCGGVFQQKRLGDSSWLRESWTEQSRDILNENLVQSTQDLRLGLKVHLPTGQWP